MKYHVLIETLDGQAYTQVIESNSKSDAICDQIFNETPNVRSVEVKCYNSNETFHHSFNHVTFPEHNHQTV